MNINLDMDIKTAKKIFEKIYEDIDGYSISNEDKRRLGLFSSEFTYGEIDFDSFIWLMEKVEVKKDDIFYDLGSGTGKPTISTALVFEPFKSVGIEILPGLYNTSLLIKESLKKYISPLPHIEFKLGDIFKEDFSEATVVFVQLTCFDENKVSDLEKKFLLLKPYSRIITITKNLKNEVFEQIESGSIKMGWGTGTYYLYLKKF
ncbi:MAG: hypothetical protein C4347_01200 [Patescibacteria group bacterium]